MLVLKKSPPYHGITTYIHTFAARINLSAPMNIPIETRIGIGIQPYSASPLDCNNAYEMMEDGTGAYMRPILLSDTSKAPYFLVPMRLRNMLKATWMLLMKTRRCLLEMNLKLTAWTRGQTFQLP
mmetsp:Transcript_32928/g.72237  ORF Transcript_32928/g.72237 Transcript_32928/m.72237 type:complete len:125 (+) Transcript_32928:156-530(+)